MFRFRQDHSEQVHILRCGAGWIKLACNCSESRVIHLTESQQILTDCRIFDLENFFQLAESEVYVVIWRLIVTRRTFVFRISLLDRFRLTRSFQPLSQLGRQVLRIGWRLTGYFCIGDMLLAQSLSYPARKSVIENLMGLRFRCRSLHSLLYTSADVHLHPLRNRSSFSFRRTEKLSDRFQWYRWRLPFGWCLTKTAILLVCFRNFRTEQCFTIADPHRFDVRGTIIGGTSRFSISIVQPLRKLFCGHLAELLG